MICELCKGSVSLVAQKTSDDTTKRTYQCNKCGNVFNTIERKIEKLYSKGMDGDEWLK